MTRPRYLALALLTVCLAVPVGLLTGDAGWSIFAIIALEILLLKTPRKDN